MPSIAFSLNNDLSKQPAGNNWNSLISGGLLAAGEETAEYGVGQGIKSMFNYRKDAVRIKGKGIPGKGVFSPTKIAGRPINEHLGKGKININRGNFTGKAGKFKAKLGQEYGFFAKEYQYMHGTKAYNKLMEQTVGRDNFNLFGRSKTGKLLNKAFRETSENYLKSQVDNVLGKGVAKNMRNVMTFMKQKSYQKAAQTVGGKFWQKGIGKGIAKTGKVAGKVGGFALKGADLITGKAFSKIATELNLDIASTAWAAKNSGMFGKTVSANMGKIAGGALLTGVQNALGAFQAASMIDLGIFATKLFTDSFAARGARIKEERDALEGLRKYGQLTSYQYQDSQAAKAMREQAVQNIMMLKDTPNEARLRSTNPYEFYRLIGG
jgi:hypothetical protein